MPTRRSGRQLKYLIAAALLLALSPARAAAWGNAGHRVIAMIAEPLLTDVARGKAYTILRDDPYVRRCLASFGGGQEAEAFDVFACGSTWADEARYTTHKDTYNWHFVDIPLSATQYEPKRDCEPADQSKFGKCAIYGLEYATKILRGAVDPKVTRAQALMFVIHIIGDLHQPIHCTVDKSHGNDVSVRLFDSRVTNLHHVWDSDLIYYESVSEEDLAEQLGELISFGGEKGPSAMRAGTPEEWAVESHARSMKAYEYLPGPKANAGAKGGRIYYELSTEYYSATIPIIEGQLAKGGVRLATYLNKILGE